MAVVESAMARVRLLVSVLSADQAAQQVGQQTQGLIMADIEIQKSQLDYHFARECPRCGDEAGRTGGINEWEGERVIELGCPDCGYVHDVRNVRWAEELSKANAPTFTPGRAVSA